MLCLHCLLAHIANMSVLWCVCVAIFVILLVNVFRRDPTPIFGVYRHPGKWYPLKYVIFAVMYFYRKWTSKAGAGAKGRAGRGIRALATPNDMDRPQPLSDHVKAFDAVFFIAAAKSPSDKQRGVYVIAGCERRPLGMCNGLFYIALPDKGLLLSPKLPDTVLFGVEISTFGTEGLKMEVIEPMKRWRISYKGKMKYQNEPEKFVDVEFQGEWSATTAHFDYDTDLYPPSIIRSVAREKWSREYFENLQTAHQSHYEQFGILNADFKINGERYNFKLPSFRDHSFGNKRDWSLMHRYAFHSIFLQNGTNISLFVICQPSTASTLDIGNMTLPNGKVLPVKWVDFKLYQHGESGHPPRDYAFRFKAGNHIYTVQVLVEYESVHFVSDEWEARMVERFCNFTVNGVHGHGASEFHYRHRDGRPESAAKDDPEWYRKMCHKV